MPPVPDHFSRCSETNRRGPELLENLAKLKLLNPRSFKKMTDRKNAIILDIRSYDSFGGQHIPYALNVGFQGNFATFSGWIIPPEKEIFLVSDSFEQSKEAVTWLRRVGLDNVVGALEGKMADWVNVGLPAKHVIQLSSDQLNTRISKGEEIFLVDARTRSEFKIAHIEGAINIPAPELRTRYKELGKTQQITLICRTGNRSSMAASLLKQLGFDVVNVAGGMTGYSAAGYAPKCPMCSAPHGPRFLGKNQI